MLVLILQVKPDNYLYNLYILFFTGSTATFLLYHLAKNPDKQDILYEEICDIIGANGCLSESALGMMKYIKAVQMDHASCMGYNQDV